MGQNINLMSSDKYTFEDLSKRYLDFTSPTYKVFIDRNDPAAKDGVVIEELSIEMSCGYEASACCFTCVNIYDEVARCFKKEVMEKYFQLGKIIEVEIGYIKTVKVFKGYISGITADFSEGMPSIYVECMDVKGAMMNNRVSEQRTEKSYSKVVEALVKKYSVLCKGDEIKVDNLEEVNRPIEIQYKSDYDFVTSIAKSLDWEFFVLQGVVYFRKPQKITPPILALEWGENLLTFSRDIGLLGQVAEVTVRSGDEHEKKVIEASIKSQSKLSAGTSSKSIIKNVKKVIVDQSITSEKEAKNRAKAELDKITRNFGKGKGSCIGLPEIVPGRFIELKKMGKDMDGKYYITKVVHNIGNQGFITSFEVGVEGL